MLVFKQVFVLVFLIFIIGNLHGQYSMPVYYATSYQPAQSGQEIEYAIDGDLTTMYHSKWYTNGMPDTLTFYFSNLVPEINSIQYTPRQDQYNGMWEQINVFAATRSNPDQFVMINSTPIEWSIDASTKSYHFPFAIDEPYAIRITVSKAFGDFSSCAEMVFGASRPALPDGSVDCVIGVKGLKISEDQKLRISQAGSFASSYQPGENIEKSFDGNLNTLYHSNWNNAYSALPVELNYHFEQSEKVDYLVYYPRKEGYNGFFGLSSIYYLDEVQNEYIYLMDYDFGFNGLDTRVNFPSTIQTQDIKIVVHSGEQGFVSCAEMEFYQKNTDTGQEPFPYSDIFTSPLYDEVQSHVTTLDIVKMEPGFYQSLAQCLLLGSYDRNIRSRDYQAYESLSTLADKLKTSRYDAYENPTGILFSRGDTIIAFAEGIGAEPVYLRVKDFANEENPDDYAYQLNNGLNVMVMRGAGLGYISYFSSHPDVADKIRVNIVNGIINGYYDINVHTSEDWVRLMSRNTYKKVDLLGSYVHLNYDRLPLKTHSPFDGHHLITLYDSIVLWQRIQMGLYKYNHHVPNHMFGVSGTGGGYYAGGQGIHLDLTWGPEAITDANRLDLWGIPHEFGHVNQIRPGLKWIGTTEVTNNVYAVWASYHLNRAKEPYTRLEAERFSTTGSPARVMNRYNSILNELYQQDTHIQETQEDYPFRVLVPFWQLQLYYQLAGACRDARPLTFDKNPLVDSIDYAHWYGYVAEKVRNTDESNLDNGTLLLNFYKNTCAAVQEDLTDYFIRMGLLRPVDTEIDDYGIGQLTITEDQINRAVQEVKSQFTTQPVSPVIHYISALTIDTYRNKATLTGQNGEGYKLYTDIVNPYMEIDHNVWKNSVAFEAYDKDDILIQATLTGTGDLTNQTTLVPMLDGTTSIFAIGFDGSKIQVWPKLVATQDVQLKQGIKVVPNLIRHHQSFRIEVENDPGIGRLMIYNSVGLLLFQQEVNLNTLNQKLSHQTFDLPGMYHVQFKTSSSSYYARFVVVE
ncbi:MAG: M60 family metallopeptidase [Saprospiraceae bacterium]|nr:M60 family metallopeptidase [Saprospiraceae bacterium]